MKDTRLEHNAQFRRRVIQRARQLERKPWADEVRKALAEWLHGSIESEFTTIDLDAPALSDFLAQTCPNLPQEHRTRFDGIFDPHADEIYDPAAWLAAQALADALVKDGTTGQHLRTVWAALKKIRPFIAYEAFQGRLAVLTAEEPAKSRLVSLIDEAVQSAAEHPERYTFRDRVEGFRRALEEWRASTDSARIWDQEYVFGQTLPEELMILGALRTTEKVTFLEILDRIRCPPMARGILAVHDVFDDFDEILALLAAAPPVFTSGKPITWTKAITAGLMLEFALEHVERLHEAVVQPTFDDPKSNQNSAFEQGEATSLFTRLVETLALRADFKPLAIAWFCQLVREEARRNRRNSPHWQPHQTACEALAKALVREGVSLNAFLEVRRVERLSKSKRHRMTERGVGDLTEIHAWTPNATDLLVAACQCKTPDGAMEGNALRDFLAEILVRRDWGLSTYGQTHVPQWRQYQPALLIATADDPATYFLDLWHGLRPQRRRAGEFIFTDDSSADDGSLFLATLATGAIDWMMEPTLEASPDNILELWEAVWNSLLPQALSASSLRGEDWWRLARLMAARLPHILQRTDQPDPSTIYKRVFGALGGDTAALAGVLNLWRLNGVTAPDATKAFETATGHSLHDTLHELREWEEREGGKRRFTQREFASLVETIQWCS